MADNAYFISAQAAAIFSSAISNLIGGKFEDAKNLIPPIMGLLPIRRVVESPRIAK